MRVNSALLKFLLFLHQFVGQINCYYTLESLLENHEYVSEFRSDHKYRAAIHKNIYRVIDTT